MSMRDDYELDPASFEVLGEHMDAIKAFSEDKARARETTKWIEAFPDGTEWLERHGLVNFTAPKFAADSNAIKRICEACGLKQTVIAKVCERSISTVSEWASRPETVPAVCVRRIADCAERAWTNENVGFSEFLMELMDGYSVPRRLSPEFGLGIYSRDAIRQSLLFLSQGQLDALVEVVRAMVIANGEEPDAFDAYDSCCEELFSK